jgi:ABC-type transporter Mla subunit MlaD
MSNKSLSQELKDIVTNITGNSAGFSSLLNNSKAFNTQLSSKLTNILKSLNQVSNNKNAELQAMKQNVQTAQQQLAECVNANAGQNAEISKILDNLKVTINSQNTTLNEITSTSGNTAQTFDKLTTDINNAISMLNGTQRAGYKKRNSISKKGKRRNKKGGWTINSESNRFSKTKKRRNSYSASSSSKS